MEQAEQQCLKLPINVTPEGNAYGIKASYFKNAAITTLTGGGGISHALESSMSGILRIGKIWKSEVNGWVYDTKGCSPALTVGQHSGVSPKILIYEENGSDKHDR